jgi:dihydroceramidase
MFHVLRNLCLCEIHPVLHRTRLGPHRIVLVHHGSCPKWVLFPLLTLVDAYGSQARYYETKDPQFHQDAYGVLTALVVFSNMYIMERTVRPALRKREQKRGPGSAIPPAGTIIKQMWLMVATGMYGHSDKGEMRLTLPATKGLSIFLGGFLLWNLDNMYCQTIRGWRNRIQLPWAVILEGHAWWHVMTGLGKRL